MKKLICFFKKPPLWFLLLDFVVAAGSTVGGTLLLTQESLFAYIMTGYVLLGIMTVTAGYAVYGFVKILPDLKNRALVWSENKPFWKRLFCEYGFRTIFFSFGSFLINLAFAAYNGFVAVAISSVWFGALSAYYILLIVLRGIIIIYHAFGSKAAKKGQTAENTYKKEAIIYGVCGIVLILLPVALSFAVMQMVRNNDSFVHSGVAIYVYAIYAFYKIIISVYNYVKTRRVNELTVRAAKNINLADALMSVLALQTAMLHEFDSESDAAYIASMNAITGAIVCLLTAFIGIFMIVIAHNKLSKTNIDR